MFAQLTFPLGAMDASTIAAIVGMVISFIIWAVNQANSKGKQEEQKKRQAQAAQQQRQRAQRAQQQKPRHSQEDEVDAFLRSAAQQQNVPQNPQRPPSGPTRPPQRPASAPLPSSRPPARPPQPQSPSRPSPQMRSTAQNPQSSTSRLQPPTTPRADYDGLQTSDFNTSANSMGHLDGHEDDLERHVHEVFDHDIGALDDTLAARDLDTFGDSSLLDADLHPRATPDRAAQPASDISDSIVEMFRNPANLRNAVIMQEVLRRPFD